MQGKRSTGLPQQEYDHSMVLECSKAAIYYQRIQFSKKKKKKNSKLPECSVDMNKGGLTDKYENTYNREAAFCTVPHYCTSAVNNLYHGQQVNRWLGEASSAALPLLPKAPSLLHPLMEMDYQERWETSLPALVHVHTRTSKQERSRDSALKFPV
ncbi:hypothetical protein UY3_13710 [Chelonia mydas]|uniref:Uncharacterized protein n=1 Tax=Chelonia mydas TaxID=8469 RepID=M7AUL3_CHEMY|nr:hypothetical protein UY3_13710 [Chelonia mydas]